MNTNDFTQAYAANFSGGYADDCMKVTQKDVGYVDHWKQVAQKVKEEYPTEAMFHENRMRVKDVIQQAYYR